MHPIRSRRAAGLFCMHINGPRGSDRFSAGDSPLVQFSEHGRPPYYFRIDVAIAHSCWSPLAEVRFFFSSDFPSLLRSSADPRPRTYSWTAACTWSSSRVHTSSCPLKETCTRLGSFSFSINVHSFSINPSCPYRLLHTTCRSKDHPHS